MKGEIGDEVRCVSWEGGNGEQCEDVQGGRVGGRVGTGSWGRGERREGERREGERRERGEEDRRQGQREGGKVGEAKCL